MKKTLIPLIIISLFFNSCGDANKQKQSKQPYLIMLSLDGFRWDYPEKANTPTLDSLTKVGVKAESLKPSFPTKTFPNHYTIATGLYPDHHGIVLNSFYANDLGKSYAIRDRDAVTNGDFYDGEPMWNVAEDQGVKTATLYWVGSSADIDKKRPSKWSLYSNSLSLNSRIDSISTWLSLPEEKRPHLIMWYYPEPDGIGHKYGPNSDEIIKEVEKLDNFVGDFFTAMRKLPNFDELNFIVTSDHGMAQLSPDRVILLDNFVDTNDLEFWHGSNPVFNLKTKDGKLEKVFNNLNGKQKHLNVWKHGEVPEDLHYGNNIRTQDITLASDSGWSIRWSWQKAYGLGTHGFPNRNSDMHAIFYAAGPAFKINHIQPTFNNVDIYPLAGEILKIKMPASDGKIENVKGMLK
jgi:alkaline phosphatase D